MTTRIRDQQLLSFAASTVWATDEATKFAIVNILGRHYEGVRLTRDELEVAMKSGRSRPEAPATGGQVQVLPLWGVLAPHAGTMIDLSTPATGLDEWVAQLQAAVEDPKVATILLHVNSPGGSAQGAEEAAKAVREARSKKQIVAVADSLAASAAYMIASQAETLIVTPSGMVGAVHCYTIHQDISAMLEQSGVKVTLIGEPDGGAAEAPSFAPLSEENLAHAEQMVSRFYGAFLDNVARGRGQSVSTVEANYGRGRVLTSEAALAAGMVDGIATFDQTLERLLSGKAITSGPRQIAAAPVAQLESFGTAPAGYSAVHAARRSELTIDPAAFAPQTHDKSSASPEAAAPVPAAQSGTTTGGTTMEAVSIDGRPPTVEELAAQQTHLRGQMDELEASAPGRAFNDDEQARFDEFEAEVLGIKATIDNINDRAARRAKLAADESRVISGVGIKPFFTNVDRKGPADIFDLASYRSHARTVEDLGELWKDGAKRANETVPYRTRYQDETRMIVEALLEQDGSNRPHDSFAHRILVTANPAYDAAFGRWLMGRESNADIGMIKMAVTNTGLGSETPVPITIDPTVLYTGDGARSPLRALAQVVTITGLTWRGIGSDGVSLAYGTESGAITPQTPSFDAPDVSVVPARGEIQFSVDVDMDWPSLRSELQRMFSQAKFRLEADKFLNGNGSNEPTGLIFALDDDGSSIVDTQTANTLALADVIKLTDELPSSFDFNATWLAHKSFYSNVAALAAAEGRIDVWVPLSGGFNQQSGLTGYNLLNSPAATASEISKLFTTGGEEVAVIGDFSQGFVIVDRVGLNVELDLHPRDTDGKWTGNRGLLCWFRNNTALRTPNAFRLLRIKHT